ncbi:MAG TPA: hypothetical protein VJY54_10915 [Lachnospiraceae bacterium]|nr:hypothetical protein [Lachnospiraceae bacterium]
MKYECDVIKDLMPLCLDKSATEASEQVVSKHMADCNSCAYYYDSIKKDIKIEKGEQRSIDKFTILAKRIRIRNSLIRVGIVLLISVWFLLCINYAAGYRFSPDRAADTSGRLNYTSRVIGSYKWKDMVFYFYDSDSCYDVVSAKHTWHGWGVSQTCLNWPKWFDEDGGIQMAGYLCHWSDNEWIQLFPVIVNDQQVKSIEVTIFGQTKTVEVKQNEFTLITFEDAGEYIDNTAIATAYDSSGRPLYTLDIYRGYWVWERVE